MKKLDIIYEVSMESLHNGIATRDSLFYKTKKGALNYAMGLVDGTKENYENEYKVEYSFESRTIDSDMTDVVYCAEFEDRTNDYPEHTDNIIITKRSLI